MRPEVLNPLFAPLTSLAGVGPRNLKLLQKLLEGETLLDLLFHLPREIRTRQQITNFTDLSEGQQVVGIGKVTQHLPPPPSARGRPWRVHLLDGAGAPLIFTFFHADKRFVHSRLPLGAMVAFSGKVESYNGQWQIAHPDYILPQDKMGEIPLYEPVYPLVAGISNRQLQKFIAEAMGVLPPLPEWIAPEFVKMGGWASFADSLKSLHFPNAVESEAMQRARARLAFDEFFASQLALRLVRQSHKEKPGRRLMGTGQILASIIEALPFELTNSQKQAWQEIKADMESPTRMLRLLQGDVGAGKTLVALMAMVTAIESSGGRPSKAGLQAALLAPTEILARQHFQTLSKLCAPTGLKLALLLGKGRGAAMVSTAGNMVEADRKQLLSQLETGQIDIAIGTHALFQDNVEFADLALVVVDEQHRFGVHQRLSLSEKGALSDVLVMTATPIPRTLQLSAYGDLDHSRLSDKPAGRMPIQTVVIASHRIQDIETRLIKKLAGGGQAYWVCPLVEDIDGHKLTSAEFRHNRLSEVFCQGLGPDWQARIGLIHGRMKAQEKEEIMARFVAGEIRILVATTVVEVGMDVPNATIMVIEHAEQFGLSQLHQLRGRVGRSSAASSCILIRADYVSDIARQRLKIISTSEDGLYIAEEDMRLRGAGEVLGVRQSGLPRLRFASWGDDSRLLQLANRAASDLLSQDGRLKSDQGQAVRNLLFMFSYDRAMNYIRSG